MTEVIVQPGPGHSISIQRTPVYQIKIERIGIPGPANSLAIGTVTEGGAASATITGQAPNQTLNLVLPEGPEGPEGPVGPPGEQGIQGVQGEPGNDGDAATIAVGTVTTVAAGDPATVTNVGTSAAAVFDFEIPQGEDGLGTGDMLAATYDPQTIQADAFDVDNHTDGTTNKVFTATEQAKLAGIEAGADVTDATNVAASGAVMDGDFSADGLMSRTGAGAYASRTITGTTNQISVANGNGDAANPTLSLASAVTTSLGLADSAVQPAAIANMLGTSDIGVSVQPFDAQLSSLVRQNSKSAAYTLVLTDGGKHIYHPAADTTARTWTIPANGTVAFPIGTVVTFDNDIGAGAITIAITTDTLVLVGAGTTGSRTLASGGQATAIKVTATRWRISGTGLT